MMEQMRLLIITGISGAGRRSACHTLEDRDWYVVDNLPPLMLKDLVENVAHRNYHKLAVVLDVRTRAEFDQIPTAFAEISKLGVKPQILFLEANDEVIVSRQTSVRRPLPLQGEDSLLKAIQRERELLKELRANADMVIDTSNINIHQLAFRVAHAFDTDDPQLRVLLTSFGFKNGIPIDADMVFDVRFLPNPYWVPQLRSLTGLAQEVSHYVLAQDGAEVFLEHAAKLLVPVFSGYQQEEKLHSYIGIGCTGGKHRSTAIAEELGKRLRALGFHVAVTHRDLGKE